MNSDAQMKMPILTSNLFLGTDDSVTGDVSYPSSGTDDNIYAQILAFSKSHKPSFRAFYSICRVIFRVSAGFVGLLGSVFGLWSVLEFFVTAL